ncbi:hypothetical protein [Mycolicibacterium sp. F2034L]|uniref:hypothetical protein n=1 Tax=Mycolicibacterium sp. F2034L TaxID=2926422 RepID=UPI001FF1C375|nr:hypothetical protein [Mycolicibacterium sp. F2034L]MCK0176252.1 hypothetical protein [Mycolicibacterium sp. F2034L]
MQQTVLAVSRGGERTRRFRRHASAVLLACCALTPVACSDVVGSEPLSSADALRPDLPVQAGDLPEAPHAAGTAGGLRVTREQRVYLDGLAAAGVASSSDLRALSIGSSVCQARAAKQSDQAVWEFILPLVRSEVRAVRPPSVAITRGEVDTATANYIRVATERLC